MAIKAREMVLNRDYTLTSLYGHSIRFTKGVPTHVPPSVQAEALTLGAEYADGKGKEVVEETRVSEPTDQAERDSVIFDAVVAIADKNDPLDFSGSGLPKADAVVKITGFRVTGKDISKAWQVRADRIADDKLGQGA